MQLRFPGNLRTAGNGSREERVSFDKPYEGVKIVDLSQGVAGPYCAMLLARHGAEVIKVEPLEGDWSRVLGPQYGDHTAYSVPGNIGKRSIAVDLKQPKGRAIVDSLLEDADIFLESYRPGVIDRLGFSYDRLKAMNPRLIYLSVSGFGQRGPLAAKPAMDPILQAFTGFMSENLEPGGRPHRTPVIIVDMATALYAHQAVVAALFAVKSGAPGRRIEASLLEGGANLQVVRLMSACREGAFIPAAAPSGTYTTRDGWIQIGVVKLHEYQGLCTALKLDDIKDDPRFLTPRDRIPHQAYLSERVAAVLATKTAREWREILTEAGLQNEIVQSYQDFVEHPHTEALGVMSWTVQPGSDRPWVTPNPPGTRRLDPDSPESRAPRVGEHTQEILRELGYSNGDIAALAADKAVGIAAPE